MSNNNAKYEVLIKQCLRSILDITEAVKTSTSIHDFKQAKIYFSGLHKITSFLAVIARKCTIIKITSRSAPMLVTIEISQ